MPERKRIKIRVATGLDHNGNEGLSLSFELHKKCNECSVWRLEKVFWVEMPVESERAEEIYEKFKKTFDHATEQKAPQEATTARAMAGNPLMGMA